MRVRLEFAGGAEFLVGGTKEHTVEVPSSPLTVSGLVLWIRDNLLRERTELFVDAGHDTVRPGILVLVNEVDWELLDVEKTQLKENDVVSFISTLHGG